MWNLPATLYDWRGLGAESLANAIGAQTAVVPTGTGDGVADDTSALSDALEQAATAGRRLDLGGKTWRITSKVGVVGSVAISGPGAVYVDGNCSGAALDLSGAWTVYDVTGAPDEVDYVLGLSATSQISRVPMGSTELAAITVPCTVKLFSSDQSSGVETGKYRGEFARAQAKDGSYLYLTGRLRETYTTDRRIAVFSEYSVLLSDFAIYGNYAAGVSANWSYALLRLQGHLSPRIERLKIQNGNAIGLELRSCVGASVSDLAIRRMRNAISTQQIPGYGVQDGGGQSNGYTNLFVEDCRHGWTTVQYTPSGDDPLTYGRSRGHTVTNGRALGCSAASWDYHSDQEGCSFINCTSYHPYAGDTEAGVGFQLRGTGAVLSQCRSFGGRVGFNITQSRNGEGSEHKISHSTSDGAVRSVRISRASTSDTGIVSATMEHCEFRQSGAVEVIQAANAELKLKDVTVTHTAADAAPRMINVEDSDGVTIRVERTTYDISGAGQSDASFCRYEGEGVEFHAYDCTVVGGAWDAIIRTSGDAPYDDVTARFAFYAATAPTQSSGYVNLGTGSDVEGVVTTERLSLYGWSA